MKKFFSIEVVTFAKNKRFSEESEKIGMWKMQVKVRMSIGIQKTSQIPENTEKWIKLKIGKTSTNN